MKKIAIIIVVSVYGFYLIQGSISAAQGLTNIQEKAVKAASITENY